MFTEKDEILLERLLKVLKQEPISLTEFCLRTSISRLALHSFMSKKGGLYFRNRMRIEKYCSERE